MALIKTITNLRTGHANSYWRLTGIAIDAHSGHIGLVLSGYADAAARAAGRDPDDRRDWTLGPSAFGLLASQPAQGATVYDVIAAAAYAVVSEQRRPLPPGAQIQESGDVLLPTGELIAAADIEGMPDAPTIPSEFAGALDV